jgi:hypothetical protein
MNEAISNFVKKPWVIPASAVFAAGVGASIGYFVSKKIIEKQTLEDTETAEVYEYGIEEDERIYVMHIPEDLNSFVEDDADEEVVLHDLSDLKNVITEEGYFNYSKESAMVENDTEEVSDEDIFLNEPEDGEAYSPEVVVNVFADSDDDWDYAVEDKYREANPDGPYVLHEDEYIRNDLGFRQSTLTYYSKDEILADDNETPMYNFKALTGDLRFGHGSGNENIVFVRNAALRMEWEILFHNGWFMKEVHGLDVEQSFEEEDLKHGNTPRKFKGEY